MKFKHQPHCFGIRTRLGRAVGKDSRYASNAVRALPSPNRDEVVLQATDGKQAVCLLAPGQMTGTRTVPVDVLPTRQLPRDAVVKLVGDHWQSSEGRLAPQHDGDGNNGAFPPIADVLPAVGKRPYALTTAKAEQHQKSHGTMPHVVLGVDIDLLVKTAAALGTGRLTLMIPVPVRSPQTKPTESYVTKPVCICPAEGDAPANGVAVLMPLTPERSLKYYQQVRQVVVEAERKAAGRSNTPVSRPQTSRGNGQPVQTATT